MSQGQFLVQGFSMIFSAYVAQNVSPVFHPYEYWCSWILCTISNIVCVFHNGNWTDAYFIYGGCAGVLSPIFWLIRLPDDYFNRVWAPDGILG